MLKITLAAGYQYLNNEAFVYLFYSRKMFNLGLDASSQILGYDMKHLAIFSNWEI